MSPMLAVQRRGQDCFPRVSGDEPNNNESENNNEQFSPREWG